MIRKYYLIITLLLLIVSAMGQPKSSRKLETTKTNIVPLENPQNSDADAYKLLYETARKSYEDERSGTQWTLGIVIGFILLILGSQYFLNWKFNKQEITNIKSDLDSKFKDGLVLLRQEYTKINEASIKKVEDNYNQQLTIYRKIIEDFEKRLQDDKTEFREVIAANKELNSLLIKEQKNYLDERIKEINMNLDKQEGFIWRLRGVEANSLSRFIDVAKYNLEKKSSLIKYTLSDIEESILNQKDLEYDDSVKLKEILKNIPLTFGELYNIEIQKINNAMLDKPLFVLMDQGKYRYVNTDGSDKK